MTRRRLFVYAGFALLAVLVVAAAGVGFVYSGLYNVAATEQHTRPVFWATDTAMRHSISRRARLTGVPDLRAPQRLERGLQLYREHCLQCHGAPGVAPAPFALGMMPIPANLVETARRWPSRNIHWVVAYGVKMTGMPAWKYRLDDAEIWDIVAFVERMAYLTPNEYAAMAEAADTAVDDARTTASRDGD